MYILQVVVVTASGCDYPKGTISNQNEMILFYLFIFIYIFYIYIYCYFSIKCIILVISTKISQHRTKCDALESASYGLYPWNIFPENYSAWRSNKEQSTERFYCFVLLDAVWSHVHERESYKVSLQWQTNSCFSIFLQFSNPQEARKPFNAFFFATLIRQFQGETTLGSSTPYESFCELLLTCDIIVSLSKGNSEI